MPRVAGPPLAALALAFAVAAAAPAGAKPGDLDRTFGNGGRVTIAVGDSNTTPNGLSLLGGVRPLVAVRAETKGASLPVLARFTAAGRLAGKTVLPPPAGPPLLDGSRSLTASFSWAAHTTQLALTGGPTSTVPGDFEPVAFGVDRAGRLLVVGTGDGGTSRAAVAARFLPDGRLDPAYGVVVLARRTIVSGGVITADGRAYAAGVRDDDAHGGEAIVAGREGVWHDRGLGSATSVIEGPAGTLLVAGAGRRQTWLVRLRRGLRRDSRFPIVKPRHMFITALARDRRERIVAAGIRGNGYPQAKLVRLTRSGAPDPAFGTVVKQLGTRRGVKLIASEVSDVAVDARGRIVVAGVSYDDEYVGRDDLGRAYLALARLKG